LETEKVGIRDIRAADDAEPSIAIPTDSYGVSADWSAKRISGDGECSGPTKYVGVGRIVIQVEPSFDRLTGKGPRILCIGQVLRPGATTVERQTVSVVFDNGSVQSVVALSGAVVEVRDGIESWVGPAVLVKRNQTGHRLIQAAGVDEIHRMRADVGQPDSESA